MSDPIKQLNDTVAMLIAQATPAQMRSLSRRLARDLRRSQQQRIKEQKNPDGSQFEARKNTKPGRMFAKLATTRHLKTRTTANGLRVGFSGRSARIARIHQYGLREQFNGNNIQYAQRQLLGFSTVDIEVIEQSILDHFTI